MFATGLAFFIIAYSMFYYVELPEPFDNRKNVTAIITAVIGIVFMVMSIIKVTWDYLP